MPVWLWLLENRNTFFDGLQNGDVFDARRLDLQGILIEDHQISEFASLQGPFGVLFFDLEGSHGRHGPQSVVGWDAFVGSDDFAGTGETVYAGIDQRQDRWGWRDGCIVRVGKG